MTRAASVGIIGGADGPTAVFVTSPVPVFFICAAFAVLAALVIGVVILLRNK